MFSLWSEKNYLYSFLQIIEPSAYFKRKYFFYILKVWLIFQMLILFIGNKIVKCLGFDVFIIKGGGDRMMFAWHTNRGRCKG